MKVSNAILMPEFERLLNNGHTVEFMPQGTSMRPFIEGGHDSVILGRNTNPKVGDIVLAKTNQQYVLHRIVKINNNDIILQGDGNLQGYEYCTKNDIIGKVIIIKNKNGKRKCLTKGIIWRHLPTCFKKLALKIYRKLLQWKKI